MRWNTSRPPSGRRGRERSLPCRGNRSLGAALLARGNGEAGATEEWERLRAALTLVEDVVTLDRPSMFGPATDRPILFSALAWAQTSLTLDRGDFGSMLGGAFYGLSILTPGIFLEQERAAGRLPPI